MLHLSYYRKTYKYESLVWADEKFKKPHIIHYGFGMH